jgi:hypothetical protein
MGVHWQTAYSWRKKDLIQGLYVSPSGRFYVDETNPRNFFVPAEKTYLYKDIFSSILIRK